MRLKNDDDGQNLLRETVLNHYERVGRTIFCFLRSTDEEGWYNEDYLLDREHVFRYSLGEDRRSLIGSLQLAIGPHYFPPSRFWDYENSERFSMEASTEAIERNLCLLDEFLGYQYNDREQTNRTDQDLIGFFKKCDGQ